MGVIHNLILILALTALAIAVARYIYSHVDREFARLARAAEDPGFRAGELECLNRLLADRQSVPGSFKAAAGPLPRWLAALPPAFIILALVCLLYRVFGATDPAESANGPLAGLFILAAAGSALAIRRRSGQERLARLLRSRADLRRLDGDYPGAAADLSESLALAPWDDSSWAELADDLAASGRLEKALEAIFRASELDPHYPDYRLLETSLALRLGRLEQARSALLGWRSLTERQRPAAAGRAGDGAWNDPRIAVYQAALELAERGREQAASALENVDWETSFMPEMAADPALAEIMKLFPALGR